MSTVTDVFAFAAKHADYWDEILSGEQNYDNVLSADEVKAFEAARTHIGTSIYELLKACGDALGKRAEADGKKFPIPRFQRATTQQNRRVQVLKSETNPGKLYGAFFSLEAETPNGPVLLYASIQAYKEVFETIRAGLKKGNIDAEDYDESFLYAPGIPIEDKKPFEDLAGVAADRLWCLLKVATEATEPASD